MNQKILDALGQLDPNNDEHWTADGLPRMDVIEGIVGDKAITRQQVTQAKPGFSRAAALAATQQPAQAQGSQGSTEQGTQAAPAAAQPPATTDPDPEQPAPDETEQPEVADSDDSDVAEAREKLADAKTALEELAAIKAKVDAEHAAQLAEVDKLTLELEELQGKETVGDAIQGYLAQQRRNLEERAQRMRAIKESGVNLGELTRNLKSPIDSAMSRKTARGTQRPGS